ncbi:MAG TPA: 6-carboxytetrahydropterin synthase QueD [Acidobacteriota bacterium]|jgi:6-pyruvoyltetrahydropterin/6-carboxytetrahydropterin synthase
MSQIYRVTKVIDFCYGHRLLNYQGECKNLHGHNGRVEIELQSAALDDRGMVVDFEEIKQQIKSWINSELDHKMILCREDPIIPLLRERKEPYVEINSNPTAENIARMIYEHAVSKNFPVRCVRLWETISSFAEYGDR